MSPNNLQSAMQPTLILLTVGGLLPWPRKRSKGMSCAGLLHTAAFVVYLVMFGLYPPPSVFNGYETNTEMVTYLCSYAFMVLTPWIAYFLVLFKMKEVSCLLDILLESDRVHPVARVYRMYPLHVSFYIMVTVCPLALVATNFYDIGDEPDTMLYLSDRIFLVFSWHSKFVLYMLTVQIALFSIVMKYRLQEVNEVIFRTCRSRPSLFNFPWRPPKLWTPDETTKFNDAGHLFMTMYELIDRMGQVYGGSLLVMYLSSIVEIINIVFYVASLVMAQDSLLHIFAVSSYTMSCAGIVVLLTYILGDIPIEVERHFRRLISIRTSDMTVTSHAQVKALVKVMSAGSSVQITAADFFSINRELLTSISASITTYIIVLAQFYSAEVGVTTEESGSNNTSVQ